MWKMKKNIVKMFKNILLFYTPNREYKCKITKICI